MHAGLVAKLSARPMLSDVQSDNAGIIHPNFPRRNPVIDRTSKLV